MCPPRVCRRVALKSFFCCRRIPFNVESCGVEGANHLFGRQCNNIWFPLRQRQRPKMTQIDKATNRRCLCWPPLFVFLCCFCFKSSCSSSRLQVSFPSFVWPKLPLINKKTYDWNKDKVSNAQLSREHLQRSHCPTSLTSLSRASVALVLWLPICDYTTLQQLPPLTGLRHLVASLRWQLEAD